MKSKYGEILSPPPSTPKINPILRSISILSKIQNNQPLPKYLFYPLHSLEQKFLSTSMSSI